VIINIDQQSPEIY
jgi:S-adenosylmethionine synthetase